MYQIPKRILIPVLAGLQVFLKSPEWSHRNPIGVFVAAAQTKKKQHGNYQRKDAFFSYSCPFVYHAGWLERIRYPSPEAFSFSMPGMESAM
jgi:hypothetical protein